MNLLVCPFGCSHHIFPDHFNFCPYCGSKLEYEKEIRNNILKVNLSGNSSKKRSPTLTPGL